MMDDIGCTTEGCNVLVDPGEWDGDEEPLCDEHLEDARLGTEGDRLYENYKERLVT